MSDLIGPALPPHLRKDQDEDESDSGNEFAGPALPPGYKRGEPSSTDESEEEASVKRLKTSHSTENQQEKTKDDNDDDGFFGPALPPGFKKQQSSPERTPVIGPVLPPGFRRSSLEDRDDDDSSGEKQAGFSGPALPPGYQPQASSSEDEDVIGPMPSKGPIHNSVALDIERRAQRMKEKLTGNDAPVVPTRESWMTELPPELQHIGLGARTFKKRSGPEKGDRSIWTDTPADRERKAKERLEGKNKGEDDKDKDSAPQLSRKDIEMAEKVTKYNESKRAESLMSLHTKKMKNKANDKADQPVERRPFDRDADLQVNRFDEAQKQRLLKKSQELNTRFSHSKDRMFL